jgi:hypothetical protein
MRRALLALIILSASASGFLVARQSTGQLQREANAAREAWLIETQRVASAQSHQDSIKAHVEDVKRILRQRPVVAEDPVWAAFQTNQTGKFTPEQHERLRKELGFNWQFSPDYIVVSKATVRSLGLSVIKDGKLTDLTATVLSLTPGERSQVDEALQRVQTAVRSWALAHVERIEPQDDEVAHYRLPFDPELTPSMSNYLATAIADAVGGERTEVFLAPHASRWIRDITPYLYKSEPMALMTLIVNRYVNQDGDSWLGAQFGWLGGQGFKSLVPPKEPLTLQSSFPEAFRSIFPNGWADVAEREGFELPKGPPKEQPLD